MLYGGPNSQLETLTKLWPYTVEIEAHVPYSWRNHHETLDHHTGLQ